MQCFEGTKLLKINLAKNNMTNSKKFLKNNNEDKINPLECERRLMMIAKWSAHFKRVFNKRKFLMVMCDCSDILKNFILIKIKL